VAKVIMINHLTLDGVMQAPGRSGEDLRGDFAYGGWAQPGNDEVMAKVMMAQFPEGAALLFGRRTYEQLSGYWPTQPDSPFSTMLENIPKFVVTRTLSTAPVWASSTTLITDPASQISALKDEGTSLVIFGSAALTQALTDAGLVDRYVVMIHPVLVGPGLRLFPDSGPYRRLALVDSTITTTGVLIGIYEPTENAG
jgi:dihydrofolate reductase